MQRALAAAVESCRAMMLEQLAQPLWFLGPPLDRHRRGWPSRYRMVPGRRIDDAVTWVRTRPRRFLHDRLLPAWRVLREGERECDCY